MIWWVTVLISLVAPTVIFTLALFFRPRATNLELHKFYKNKAAFYKNKVDAVTIFYKNKSFETKKMVEYKELANTFLSKEVNRKIRIINWTALSKGKKSDGSTEKSNNTENS